MGFRILLVGLGNRGRMWASIVEQVEGVELSGVVEVNPATLAVFGVEHPDVPRFNDLTEALAGTASDAVLLVTRRRPAAGQNSAGGRRRRPKR